MNSLLFLAREAVRAVWLVGRHVVESRRPVYEQGDWLDVADRLENSSAEPVARTPRVVTKLGRDERDAVWQCQELAPTRLWNPLYRWNGGGWWEYERHGLWTVSSAGAHDVSARTINPVSSEGFLCEFTEVLHHHQSSTVPPVDVPAPGVVDAQPAQTPGVEAPSVDWVETAIRDVLADNMPFADLRYDGIWREHVAPLIAARIAQESISLYRRTTMPLFRGGFDTE